MRNNLLLICCLVMLSNSIYVVSFLSSKEREQILSEQNRLSDEEILLAEYGKKTTDNGNEFMSEY